MFETLIMSLLTKEAALKRHRRAVKDLMKWHKKLLEEERRIFELEAIVNIIVPQTSNNFMEDHIYAMPQIPMECFCKYVGACSKKTQKISNTTEATSKFSKPRINYNMPKDIVKMKSVFNRRVKMNLEQYRKLNFSKQNIIQIDSSDLDIESVNHIVNVQECNVLKSSINQLINSFCKIKKDLYLLGMEQYFKPVSTIEYLLLINNDFKEEVNNVKIDSNLILHPNQIIPTFETYRNRSSQNKLSEHDVFEIPSKENVILEVNKNFRHFSDRKDKNSSDLQIKENTNRCKKFLLPLKKSRDSLVDTISFNKLSERETNKSSNVKNDNSFKMKADLVELSQGKDISAVEKSEDICLIKKKIITDVPSSPKNDGNCFKQAVNVPDGLLFDGTINFQNISNIEKAKIVENSKDKDITSNIIYISDEDIRNTVKIKNRVTESVEGLGNNSTANRDTYINPVIIVDYKKSIKEMKLESTTFEDHSIASSTITTKKKHESNIIKLEERYEGNLGKSGINIYSKLIPNSPLLWKDTLSTKESIESYKEENCNYRSLAIVNRFQLSPASSRDQPSATVEHFFGLSNDKLSCTEKSTDNVEKQMPEIIVYAQQSIEEDKNLKLVDFPAYYFTSSVYSSKLGSPIEDQKLVTAETLFDSEAEVLKKQLTIEREINNITGEQQKEQLPLLFARDIPNKPPPPYTPPSSLLSINTNTIVPTPKEIEEITKYSAKILYKAYLSNNLDIICISENTLSLVSKNITKECYKFVFDLCKEVSKEHSKLFEKEICSSWLKATRKPQLTVIKPLHINELENYIYIKLQKIFQCKVPQCCETTIIKWNQKKRDNVDEILVTESLAEETLWTNYDKDELFVMNEITKVILKIVFKETVDVYMKILTKTH